MFLSPLSCHHCSAYPVCHCQARQRALVHSDLVQQVPVISTPHYYWPLMWWSKPERCKRSIKTKTLSQALQVFSSKGQQDWQIPARAPLFWGAVGSSLAGTGVPIHSCTESAMVLKMFCWTRILNVWKICITWFLLFMSKLNIKIFFLPVWFAIQINKYFAFNRLQNRVAQIPPLPVLVFVFFLRNIPGTMINHMTKELTREETLRS